MTNREPTALVSVSECIVDTLQRAFDKHHRLGEPAADIWAVFVRLPAGVVVTGDDDHHNERPTTIVAPRIHPAESLAQDLCKLKHPSAQELGHEFVFEWAIPESYVLHKVSLETLIGRGFTWEILTGEQYSGHFSTEELRCRLAEHFWLSRRHPWQLGVDLAASFAIAFGGRAPLDWLGCQFFSDCLRRIEFPEDQQDQAIRLFFANQLEDSAEQVDLAFFHQMEDGIDAAVEFHVKDTTSSRDYDEFQEHQKRVNDTIRSHEAAIRKLWKSVNAHPSRALRSIFASRLEEIEDRARDEHMRLRESIEAEAVKIGL